MNTTRTIEELEAEVERLTTLAHGQHINLYNARLQLAAAQGQEPAGYFVPESWDQLGKVTEWAQAIARHGQPLYAAPIPQQVAEPSVPEGWKQAVALAYGHLWHVNNEPMAPIPLRSSETAAYEARKQLRDLLTHEERGIAINQVQAMLAAALQPKEPTE